MRVKVYFRQGPRQRFQSACGDAPSDAFLAGAIQRAARSGRFSVGAGTRAPAPFSASGALPPLRSGQGSLDETEHFPAQSRSQRRYAPTVFGIIPERRSASLRTSVHLRRNPHLPICAEFTRMPRTCHVSKEVSFATFREAPENQGIARLKTPSQNDAIKFGYLSVYPGTGPQRTTLLNPTPHLHSSVC